ncbi:MAG: hypothetical protein WC676_01485 [Candidatus Omnitrophota bacterium]
MFRKLNKKRGQNTAEYAILIALVVGAVIAMQVYAKRALQARVYDATQYMADNTSELGTTTQFEPTQLTSAFDVSRNSESSVVMNEAESGIGMTSNSDIQRLEGGFQEYQYNGPGADGGGGGGGGGAVEIEMVP